MRTYIQPLKKSVEDEIKVRLDHDVAQGLKDYCEFLQSPQSYVVTEILRKTLRKDKAFVGWREQRSDSTATDNSVSLPRRSRRVSAPAEV